MKTILFSAALLMGGVAYAQADPSAAGQPIGSGASLTPGTTMGERDTHGANMPAAGTTTMGTTGTTMTTTGDTSMGTTMGTTGSGVVAVQGGNMVAPPEQRASYPRCSRTITDNCVQDESRARDTRRTRR